MDTIQVNAPYSMLLRRIDFVLKNRINPEIYFSAEELDTLEERDVNRISEILNNNGLEITIHGPYMDLSPGGLDRRVKEVTIYRFKRTIELATLFNPKAIIFHPGYEKWKFDGNVELWLKSSIKTWEPLVEEASHRGLNIAIENVFEETPDSIVLLLGKIDSQNFRFCLDTGHLHIFSKAGVSLWLETLGEYLIEVHLHDNHKERDEHLPIGEGSFNFEEFFSIIFQRGLRPIYTIEPHEESHLWRGLEAVQRYIKGSLK